MCVYIFGIYLSVGWYLHCFQVLALVNTAAVNMGYFIIFEILVVFPLDTYPEVGFLDHMVLLFFSFLSNLQSVFHNGYNISHNTNLNSHKQCTRAPFSPHSPILVTSYRLGNSQSNRCEVISHLDLISISLMITAH